MLRITASVALSRALAYPRQHITYRSPEFFFAFWYGYFLCIEKIPMIFHAFKDLWILYPSKQKDNLRFSITAPIDQY